MSQTVNRIHEALPGLPRKPLTPQQQLDAISRVQTQAEARVELGLKLFKAAENHTRSQQKMLEQIKAEQQQLREQVNEDVAKSLHAYDQWVGQMDDNFTQSLQNLEAKIERLQENWTATQQRIEAMIERSAEMFAMSHGMPNVIENPLPKVEVSEAPHSVSIMPERVEVDIEVEADQTQDDVEEQAPIVQNKPKTEPRLKPESGAMYTDLLRQLRSRADERKTQE
jgi:flagellar biosynthesis chaperone FliJ